MYFGTIHALDHVDSVSGVLQRLRRRFDGDVGGTIPQADDQDALARKCHRSPRVDEWCEWIGLAVEEPGKMEQPRVRMVSVRNDEESNDRASPR